MSLVPDSPQYPGLLVTFDGPGGVGKSTVLDLAAHYLTARSVPVHVTAEPSGTDLGKLIRVGTETYRDMALACLVAGDRHHHLTTEILPALRAGRVVLCDRYIASSLVLQGIDGIGSETIWALHESIFVPDLSVLLNADPEVLAARLDARGRHSRFEHLPDSSRIESDLYYRALVDLRERGWPLIHLNCSTYKPESLGRIVTFQILSLYRERSAQCPA